MCIYIYKSEMLFIICMYSHTCICHTYTYIYIYICMCTSMYVYIERERCIGPIDYFPIFHQAKRIIA